MTGTLRTTITRYRAHSGTHNIGVTKARRKIPTVDVVFVLWRSRRETNPCVPRSREICIPYPVVAVRYDASASRQNIGGSARALCYCNTTGHYVLATSASRVCFYDEVNGSAWKAFSAPSVPVRGPTAICVVGCVPSLSVNSVFVHCATGCRAAREDYESATGEATRYITAVTSYASFFDRKLLVTEASPILPPHASCPSGPPSH